MVAAIIVPEVVTASAFAQRVAARSSVHAMKNLGYHWTMQHAFYLNMGGVWLQPKDSKAFPPNATQLQHLVTAGYMDSPAMTEKEIWDKSKADKFAKIFACGQIGWLVLQCMGRKIQHLPITALEIATLGFAIPSVATLLLWFYKPADIEVPSFIKLNESTAELLERISPVAYSWRQTPLDFIDTVNSPSFTSEIILKTSVASSLHFCWSINKDSKRRVCIEVFNTGSALHASCLDWVRRRSFIRLEFQFPVPYRTLIMAHSVGSYGRVDASLLDH